MKFSHFRYRVLFRDPVLPPHPFFQQNNDAGGGGTTSETDDKTTETVKSATVETTKTEIPHNLTTEELRDQLRSANSRISDLNAEAKRIRLAAKTSDEDKAELESYRKLGLKPDELKTQLAEGQTAKTQNAETRRLGELERAAKDLGFKPSLLKRLAPAREVLSKEVDVKGEDGKYTKETRWFFKEGESETEIVKEFDDETLALLKNDEATATTAQTQVQSTAGGRPFVTQGGGNGKGKSVYEKIAERNRATSEEKPKSFLDQSKAAGMTN